MVSSRLSERAESDAKQASKINGTSFPRRRESRFFKLFWTPAFAGERQLIRFSDRLLVGYELFPRFLMVFDPFVDFIGQE